MVEAITRAAGAGGGGAVVAVADHDMGDGMQCSDHPYRNSSPGGICAFCLQEKLGKLVSSSSSSFFVGSSSSPSFRSDGPTTATAVLRLTTAGSGVNGGAASASSGSTTLPSLSLSLRPAASTTSNGGNSTDRGRSGEDGYNSRRARIPFLLAQKKKKKTLSAASTSSTDLVLKRSKSAATPRSSRYFSSDNGEFSPRRRGFWSFLHLSNPKKSDRPKVGPGPAPSSATTESTAESVAVKRVEYVVVDEADSSPNSSGGGSNTASFGRKVSRSRSVGCGSRSFSGDFFERISTGFGDCTLRRVESQREGRRSTSAARSSTGDPIKERVRCGGLFGGFMITSSSSSSSSSSYWASVAEDHQASGRPTGSAATPGAGPLVHGRSRSWGRAFASPMRAFSKPSTTTTTTIKDGKRDSSGDGGGSKNSISSQTTNTPDLAAIPSLLAVRG